MNLYVTGDTHGMMSDTQKLFMRPFSQVSKNLTKEDCVVVLGDFGWCFNATKSGGEANEERKMLDHLDRLPFTTLFIDGNHENFDMLYKYPESEAYGGKVGVLRPTVLHLKERGHIYDICGRKCWCFGGAYSTDKAYRISGKSWWEQEMPTADEYTHGTAELDAAYCKVDYIFTHDAPFSLGCIIEGDWLKPDTLTEYLDGVAKRAVFRTWYFAHHHRDAGFSVSGRKYRALYMDIRNVDDEPLDCDSLILD